MKISNLSHLNIKKKKIVKMKKLYFSRVKL